MLEDGIAIDADGHVLESDELFTEYLDPAFRAQTRGMALNADNNRRFIVDGVGHHRDHRVRRDDCHHDHRDYHHDHHRGRRHVNRWTPER